MPPKVSIGMPTYNRADYLRETIPMVLNQSFKDFELIVCDDHSSDETPEVIKSFHAPKIRYYRNQENCGIPKILNKILELMTGKYLIMLHDHDIFHYELIQKMVQFLDQHPSAGFVHPGVAWIDPDGSRYEEFLSDFSLLMKGEELAKKILLGRTGFSCPITACSMVRLEAFKKVGFYFDEQFGFISDVDLWFRLMLHFDVGYLRAPLLTCRRREAGHSFNWDWIKWSADIYRTNIIRCFSSDQRMKERGLKIWAKSREEHFLKSLMVCVAKGDRQSFERGLEICSKEDDEVMTFVAEIIMFLRFLHPLLMISGPKLAALHRRFRGGVRFLC